MKIQTPYISQMSAKEKDVFIQREFKEDERFKKKD